MFDSIIIISEQLCPLWPSWEFPTFSLQVLLDYSLYCGLFSSIRQVFAASCEMSQKLDQKLTSDNFTYLPGNYDSPGSSRYYTEVVVDIILR